MRAVLAYAGWVVLAGLVMVLAAPSVVFTRIWWLRRKR